MNTNDITGDKLITDIPTDDYKTGWDAIWGKKKEKIPETTPSLGTEKEPYVSIGIVELKQMIDQMEPITLKPKYAPELTEVWIKSFVPDTTN